MAEMIDTDVRVQDFHGQKRELLTRFVPAAVDCLPARIDEMAAGIVMTKPHSAGTCELNWMHVRAPARGQCAGWALVAGILATGRAPCLRLTMLAAGPRDAEAVALYRSFGFAEDTSLPDAGAGDVEVKMIRVL